LKISLKIPQKFSSVATWLSFGTKSINFIVVLPLLLNKIELKDISFWYLFNSLIWITNLTDAGFGTSIARFMGYTLKEDLSNDEENIKTTRSEIWKSALFVYKRIIFLIFIGLLTVGSSIFYIPINSSSNTFFGWITWIIAILLIPVITFNNLLISILTGLNKVITLRLWESVFNMGNILFSLIILLFSPNIYLMIINLLSWQIFSTIRNYILFKRQNIDSTRKVNDIIKKDIIQAGVKTSIGTLLSAGIFQFIGFFYSWYFNIEQLASYLFAMNLIWNIRNFAQAPFYDKLPIMYSLMAQKKIIELRELAKKYMLLTYVSYSFIFLCITFLQKYFLSIINSKTEFVSISLWILLGFGFLLERYGAMHLQVYTTTNHVISHKANSVTGIILIILMIFSINTLKLYTFPICFIISYLAFYVWYSVKKSYKLLQTTFWEYEKKLFIPFIFIFFILIVTKILLK
jgi:hypothetical protein